MNRKQYYILNPQLLGRSILNKLWSQINRGNVDPMIAYNLQKEIGTQADYIRAMIRTEGKSGL